MHWIDWVIVAVPIIIVVYNAFKAQKYVKGVSDFLTGGRVAGRYVLAVASAGAEIGLISIVCYFEIYYNSGFAYDYWIAIGAPILIIFALTGYCVYRFRETRAMTMGQFLEIRYSRRFRIFAAILQTISGVINYALFPAVGARFLVYFCDLPVTFSVFGFVVPTFALLMAIFLSIAVFVATLGGQITVMVTDAIQGLLSYPIFFLVVAYLFWRFSWTEHISPTLLDRPDGKSMVNPFDIEKLRDFNLFYILVGIFSSILNYMGWSGTQGYKAAALNAHEQKMGSILGVWRYGFSSIMYILIGMVAFTFLNNALFREGSKGAVNCRNTLALKVFNDVAHDQEFDAVRNEYEKYIETGEISEVFLEKIDFPDVDSTGEGNSLENDKESIVSVGRDVLETVSPKRAQIFEVIFGQMRVPMALRYILPVGIMGAFCALCIFLLISTDTTYMHSWSSIIIQDLILPIRGKPFTPRQQLRLLRITIICVALFAFFFSYFFGQVDYIAMFFAITGLIWVGGSGPCIIGGLYWKRGTTAGAWTALLVGSSIAVGGFLAQQYWVEHIYPWLNEAGMLGIITIIIERASAPFEPYVMWRVTADKFPINSQEMTAISMLLSIGLYAGISLLTCRKPFNMDRMLHRGKYKREGSVVIQKKPFTFRTLFTRLVGITEEYSRGDKILAWSVFIYSFGWKFVCVFFFVVMWNIFIGKWSEKAWLNLYFFDKFLVGGIIAVVSTIWFSIGTIIDLKRLYKRLESKEVDILDDGRVVGHVSADDVKLVEKVENEDIEQTRREEKELKEMFEDEEHK